MPPLPSRRIPFKQALVRIEAVGLGIYPQSGDTRGSTLSYDGCRAPRTATREECSPLLSQGFGGEMCSTWIGMPHCQIDGREQQPRPVRVRSATMLVASGGVTSGLDHDHRPALRARCEGPGPRWPSTSWSTDCALRPLPDQPPLRSLCRCVRLHAYLLSSLRSSANFATSWTRLLLDRISAYSSLTTLVARINVPSSRR